MKHSLVATALLLIALFSTGCSVVRSTNPLPLSLEAVTEDKEKLEGSWIVDDKTCELKFDDKGIAKLAGIDWHDGAFKLTESELIITKGKAHNFMSFRTKDEEGKWDGYYIIPYTFTEDGDLVIWFPNIEIFSSLVNDKKLKGEVNKKKYSSEVIITSDAADLQKLIDDPKNYDLYDYRQPYVLKKLNAKD